MWWKPFKEEPRKVPGPVSEKTRALELLAMKTTKRKALRYISRLLNKDTKWSRVPEPDVVDMKWMVDVYPLVHGLDNTEVLETLEEFYDRNGVGHEKDCEEADLAKTRYEGSDIFAEVVEYITDVKKKVNKEASNILLPKIYQLKAMLDVTLQTLAIREGEIRALKTKDQTQSKDEIPKVTFAQVAKRTEKGKQKEVQPPKKVVLAYPEKDGQTSDETKALIQDKCHPTEEGWKVKNFRRIRGGGMLIEAGDEQTLTKIKNSQRLKEIGLRIEEPKKRGPKVIIYDIPRTDDNDKLLERLFQQNLQDKGFDKEETIKQMTIRLRTGKNKDNVNIVIEGPAKIRHELIKQETVYIGFAACKVKDFLVPMRCYKCQQYGHLSKTCKGKDRCSKCGDEGHGFKECNSKEKDACANCKKDGKEHKHRVDSKMCPHFDKAFAVEIERIDYGC